MRLGANLASVQLEITRCALDGGPVDFAILCVHSSLEAIDSSSGFDVHVFHGNFLVISHKNSNSRTLDDTSLNMSSAMDLSSSAYINT